MVRHIYCDLFAVDGIMMHGGCRDADCLSLTSVVMILSSEEDAPGPATCSNSVEPDTDMDTSLQKDHSDSDLYVCNPHMLCRIIHIFNSGLLLRF